jgi:hypothetical protein
MSRGRNSRWPGRATAAVHASRLPSRPAGCHHDTAVSLMNMLLVGAASLVGEQFASLPIILYKKLEIHTRPYQHTRTRAGSIACNMPCSDSMDDRARGKAFSCWKASPLRTRCCPCTTRGPVSTLEGLA